MYPATPELMTLSINICFEPFQKPLTDTLSHFDDSSDKDDGFFLMLLLNFQGKEDTEHQDLLNAELNRDVKLAQKLLKNHIESAETYLMHAY